MFGWFKTPEQRLVAHMAALVRVAQMATYAALANSLGVDSAHSMEEKTTIGTRAAVRVNFLFGVAPSQAHKQFDLAKEHRLALDWLETNLLFRELVVQSLRVTATGRYGAAGTGTVSGKRVLARHGRDFPDAPDPTTYPQLVQRAIGALTNKQQVDINAWAQRNA